MKKKISLIILLVVISLSLGVYFLSKSETKTKLSLENNNMLSFTVDGVESKTMPTKGSKYIASKITCTKGSIIVFDNDNWTIEAEKLETDDACKIDFSKETGSNTVTITISDASKIDSTSKTTTEGGKVIFYVTEEPDSITGGEYTLTDNKLMVSNVTTNVNLNITMTKTLYDKLLADNPSISERTDFINEYADENKNIIYQTTENGTTVYYFAGNPINNWVKFAGFYWRIIRTNSDGSIRIIYYGTNECDSDNTQKGETCPSYSMNGTTYQYASFNSSATWVNYSTSIVKKELESWYQTNLNSLSKYISFSAIYCNDVSSQNVLVNSRSETQYGSYYRSHKNINPTYDCEENSISAYTTTNENAKLTYPIGLITGDELRFAGGFTSGVTPKCNTWLNFIGWTMSPANYGQFWSGKNTANLIATGTLSYVPATYTSTVSPVISLKSCVKYSSGDGSSSNPYEIKETESGC